MVSLTVNPPSDAVLRKKTFTQRNSPQNIKALCLRLNAALEPKAPGLDKFRELVDNYLCMHGRRSFKGSRKVLASLVAA